MWKCKHIQGLCGNLVSIPSPSSAQSYRISGLDQEPVNPPAAENTTLSPVEVENAACVDVPVSRDWFLGMGGPSWCEWEQPPSSSSAAPAAQAAPGECHTLGCCHRNTPPKKHTKSHLFHHHLKEREGNLCKVLKGAGQWWWLHRHGPSPKFHQNLGDHCSVGSRGAAKLTVATAPMRNRAKQQGKDFYIRQMSPSHLQGAQGAATGIKSGSERCADGTCLLPSCCYFLQTGIANPPLWLFHEVNWHMVLAAPSLTDTGLGRPHGSRAPKTLIGEKKKKKTKRKRSWSAGALWFVSRGAPQPVGSAAQGALPGEESSALSFSLFHVFLVEPEEHLESSPSLGYHTLKGYERALIWGKNRVCPPWPWWLVLQNECPETGNIWELGITKHLCGPGDLYSAISTSCQRKRQEIIWETEDHI